MTRSTASRRARNSDSVRTGGRRRPCSRPSRRRCFLASSRVEPLTPLISSSRLSALRGLADVDDGARGVVGRAVCGSSPDRTAATPAATPTRRRRARPARRPRRLAVGASVSSAVSVGRGRRRRRRLVALVAFAATATATATATTTPLARRTPRRRRPRRLASSPSDRLVGSCLGRLLAVACGRAAALGLGRLEEHASAASGTRPRWTSSAELVGRRRRGLGLSAAVVGGLGGRLLGGLLGAPSWRPSSPACRPSRRGSALRRRRLGRLAFLVAFFARSSWLAVFAVVGRPASAAPASAVAAGGPAGRAAARRRVRGGGLRARRWCWWS